MSYVTSVILLMSISEDMDENTGEYEQLAKVNAWEGFSHHQGFTLIEPAGGTKPMNGWIAAGGFNYLDLAGLLKHLKGLHWAEPGAVQVVVNHENDDKWRLIDVFGPESEALRE